MTDVSRLLQDGDPLREGGELSPVDAQRMRRVVLATALEAAAPATPWRRPFAMAGIAALLVVVGTMTGHRVLVDRAPAPDTVEPIVGGGIEGDRRQLQFATPGGTRIIWIFDESLRLQESMP